MVIILFTLLLDWVIRVWDGPVDRLAHGLVTRARDMEETTKPYRVSRFGNPGKVPPRLPAGAWAVPRTPLQATIGPWVTWRTSPGR